MLKLKRSSLRSASAAACLAMGGALAAGPVLAQKAAPQQPARRNEKTNANADNSAQHLVGQAVNVVQDMKKDPRLVKLLKQAKGVYIVPDFGRGAVIVGGRGGAGLVLVKQGDHWSDPAFYDFGGISFGPQIGASGGSVAFLLMDQSAVDAFKSGNKVSLNAGAGLSIVKYSANGQASWGKGDIIMWSDTAGAYAGATVSVSDVNWDDGRNRSYYGPNADMSKIFSDGSVKNNGAEHLDQVLPM